MRKPIKIAAFVAGALALLAVALVILVRVVVTPERIKAVLLPRVEQALGRQVSLGDIEVSLLSGIVLHDLTVREKQGTEPFVAAERVVLRYQLWPLLSRRVVVDEVRLDSPSIRVERYRDGTFNFSDLLKEKGEKRERGAVDLLVSEVAVNGGELLFLDHKVGNGAPYRLQVTGFDLSASDISPAEPFPWEMRARMGAGTFSASGRIDPGERSGRIEAEVSNMEAAPFSPYFRDKVPGRLNAMTVSGNLTAEGGKEKLESEGKVRLDGIDFLWRKKSGEEVPIRGASLGLDYDAAANLNSKALSLGESTLTLNGVPVKLSGTVRDYSAERRIDMEVVVPEFDLRPALKSFPPALLPSAVAGLDPAGKLSARARLSGPASLGKKLLQSGEVRLGEVAFNLGKARAALTGALRLAGGAAVSENLVLHRGEDRAAIDLKASNLFGEPIQVRSAVRSDRFALDPLLKGAPPPEGRQPPPAPAPTETGKPAARKPLKLPLRSEGTVQIARTVYKGLTVENLLLRHQFDRGVLTVPQLTGRTAGGAFRTQARLDLGRPAPPFSLSFDLQGLQADPLVTAFFPKAAGVVFGTLNMNTRLEGVGTGGAEIRRTLSGRGNLVLRNGQLTGAGLVKGLADFLNLEELRVLRFSEAKGAFTIAGGKLQLDSDFNGRDVRMHPKGTVALEDYALDIALQPRFSPELTRKLDSRGTVTRFLVDAQGWGQLPLKVGGTLTSPRFYFDVSGVRERVREKAGEEVRKRLQKGLEKILPPKKEQQGTQPQGEEPRGGTLEETFRGLMGK